MNEILQKIRTDLRRSMNGIVSTSMRQKGMDYKLNFGVDIPRLRQLANGYEQDTALAEFLWKQETRELKILATMLYQAEKLDLENAERWVREIPNHEIREQICMNLLQKSGFADDLVQNCTQSPDEEIRTTGYWLFARLTITQSGLLNKINTREILGKAVTDLQSDSYFLRLSAQNALKFMGRNSQELAGEILHEIRDFENADDVVKREIYAGLRFEFGNYWFLSR